MGNTNRNSVYDINVKKPKGSKLTAIRLMPSVYNGSGKSYSIVECRCECGVVKSYIVDAVIRGGTVCCGCERKGKPNFKIRSKYPVHLRKVYQSIIDRCYNKKDASYSYYGGRGVRVCDEWRKSKKVFCEWALANGWEKGLQIDKDIKGGKLYSPETCIIVTSLVNNNNARGNKKMMFDGDSLTLAEIARRIKWNDKKLYAYVSRHGKLPF